VALIRGTEAGSGVIVRFSLSREAEQLVVKVFGGARLSLRRLAA
jgi:hypothetical protein